MLLSGDVGDCGSLSGDGDGDGDVGGGGSLSGGNECASVCGWGGTKVSKYLRPLLRIQEKRLSHSTTSVPPTVVCSPACTSACVAILHGIHSCVSVHGWRCTRAFTYGDHSLNGRQVCGAAVLLFQHNRLGVAIAASLRKQGQGELDIASCVRSRALGEYQRSEGGV